MDIKYVKKYLLGINRHNLKLYNLIKEQLPQLLTEETYQFVVDFYNELSNLGHLNYRLRIPFINSCIWGLINNNITLFSMCSHSLTENSNILRDKQQYYKIAQLSQIINQLSSKYNIKITYICLLPDYDEKFSHHRYQTSWDMNVQQIKDISSVNTYRLSQFSLVSYSSVASEIRSNDEIMKNITKYSDYYCNNKFLVLGFDAPADFQKQQIYHYTITGVILERTLPFSILIDVQKKDFPFEQKFYNFARQEKLPIFFCGQQLLNN